MKTGKEEDLQEEEEDSEESNEEADVFSCKYCEFETADIDVLDEHIVTHVDVDFDEDVEETEALEAPVEEPEYSIQTPRKRRAKNPDFSIELPQNGSNNNEVKKKAKLDTEVNQEDSDTENPQSTFMYVCPYCNFQTVRRKELGKHITEHETPIEIMIYKCSECPYQTKRKCDMPKHLLTHCQNAPMYKCPVCDYKTKRKNDLPKHILCHKHHGETTVFECDICTYVTKRKGDLNKHRLAHKNYGTIHNSRVFKCTECGYTSKRLNDLHKHSVLHCDRQYSDVFKCLKCDYASDKSNKFARHVLTNCEFTDDCVQVFPKDPESMVEYILVEKDMALYNLTDVVNNSKDSEDLQEVVNHSEEVELYTTEATEEDVEVAENESGKKVLVLSDYPEQSIDQQ